MLWMDSFLIPFPLNVYNILVAEQLSREKVRVLPSDVDLCPTLKVRNMTLESSASVDVVKVDNV
jgi:hypothetical protein